MQNLIKYFLVFCLFSSFSLATSDLNEPYPLLLASNENLEELSTFWFTEYNDLIDVYFNKSQQKSKLPKKNIFYVVSTPYDSLETLNYMTQNKGKYGNLMNLLKNKKKSFSSKYVQYTFPQMESYIMNKYVNETLENQAHEFISPEFKDVHQSLMKSTKNTLEIIHFSLNGLKDLNVQLYEDIHALSHESYSLFIGFQKVTQPSRLLQEASAETTTDTTSVTTTEATASTTVVDPTPTPTPTPVNPDSLMPLRIQPYVMTGYLFSLLALFVALLGSIALCSVQAPDKFPRLPLLVGRESN